MSSSSFIMAIDQGTTSSRTCIVNQAGGLVAEARESFKQIFPKPGWVEHDPEDIWHSTQRSMRLALEKAKISGSQIAAIGITNQRETVMVWDRKTGKSVYNAIVWQCRRTQEICEKLKKAKKEKMITAKTGLVLDPYFSASKIQWILKNAPKAMQKARAGQLVAGNVDTYLLWRLTAGTSHKTDVSNASRTMLMNIHTGWWDEELMKLFNVPQGILPEICPSNADFGRTQGLGFMPDGIPITGMIGDQQSALFGQICFEAGESKCTFGTGSFVLLNTGKKIVKSKNKLLSTVAWKLKNEEMTYALEGGAFVCGAAVQWLRDGLGLFQQSADVEKLAKTVEDTQGVEFVPALTGLGAPHWQPEARGLICGLTRGTTKAHIARATLEAMALQNVDVLVTMQKDLGKKIKTLKVDGGAAANDLLMQMQADYLGLNVIRPQNLETTAMGAAFMAGLGAGFWKDVKQLKRIWKTNKEFKVKMQLKARKERMQRWEKALERV
ncbi:glycerol kinase GlpK [Bdellovibrio svalbardensis]|uniref:Glycerol kinase n=1 Tax=Bdellovibrio svalbardensis TaxID=2972972 RepID=A0ABT6DGE2_9BACT|nr:glycerol kinase GlpK [Bdellovibrio svalbardensis]MDG0815892.1 glycerol kinase GlpK [Bdellovibrio svalbardensis]